MQIFKYNTFVNLTFILLLAYTCIGVFPFAHYETDALGIISGCKNIIETGIFKANYYTYSFEMQPGIYFFVILISKVFGLNLVSAYSLVSSIFGIGFFLLSTYFVSKLTNVTFALAGLLLFLFQESYSAWYYMNSATGAAVFMMAGLLCLLYKTNFVQILVSSILLSLAAWIRFDIVLVFPVIFFLVDTENLLSKLKLSFALAALFLIFTSTFYYLSNLSLFELITQGVGGNSISFSDNFKTSGGAFSSQMTRSFIGFFSVLILFLIGLGTTLIYQKKLYKLLAITYVPFIIFLFILKGNITAGKHLLYYFPFFAIPVVFLLNTDTFGVRKVIKYAGTGLIAFLFFIQYMVGFQFFPTSHPYIAEKYSSQYPTPTYASLLKLRFEHGSLDSLAFVLGGGMKLPTADEMLLSSGIVHSPIMWYQLKQESNIIYTSLAKFVIDFPEDTLYITASQGGGYPIKNILYLEGFELTNPESDTYQWAAAYEYVWKKNTKTVIVNQGEYPKDYDLYMEKIKSTKCRKFLHLAFWDWERWYINKSNAFSHKVNDASYLFDAR